MFVHNRTHDSRLHYLRVLQPTRVLDSLHRNPLLHDLRTTSFFPMSPYRMFTNALHLLGPHQPSSMIPLNVSWKAQRLVQDAVEIATIDGLRAYLLPGPPTKPDCTYTDSSKIGSPPASGAAAVLQDGRIVICRVPGAPNSYKAKVIGILLNSELSPRHSTLGVDCKGAIWTHDLVPAHTHDHFHPSSWTPLQYRRLAWHIWLFGLQTRRGYSHYASFWKDESHLSTCMHCGVLSFCSPSRPLVQAWLSAWPTPALITR